MGVDFTNVVEVAVWVDTCDCHLEGGEASEGMLVLGFGVTVIVSVRVRVRVRVCLSFSGAIGLA